MTKYVVRFSSSTGQTLEEEVRATSSSDACRIVKNRNPGCIIISHRKED